MLTSVGHIDLTETHGIHISKVKQISRRTEQLPSAVRTLLRLERCLMGVLKSSPSSLSITSRGARVFIAEKGGRGISAISDQSRSPDGSQPRG